MDHGFIKHQKDTSIPLTTPMNEILDEDFPVNIPNQSFALISYLGPKTNPSASWYGLRIYGTFSTIDEATRAAKTARDRGFNSWDLFIVDIFHGFFPMPPPCDSAITDVQYHSDILTQLMQKDRDDMNESSKRVAQRAAGEVQVKSASELMTELAEAALTEFQQTKELGRSVIISSLVNRFEQISNFS